MSETGSDTRIAETPPPGGGRAEALRTLAHRLNRRDPALPVEGRLSPFHRATGWLNSDPLTPSVLRGRVVLVDFWTYTCVNWLRTLPYLRAWHEKYHRHGLTIVGVHTPEFGFERDPGHVQAACTALGVTYPVALDAQYGVWEEFANRYWPAVYLADADGRVRFHHFGEGEYATTEMLIQQLLADSGSRVDTDLVAVSPVGLEVAADWHTLRSPETYLGYGRAMTGSPADIAPTEQPQSFGGAEDLALNSWTLAGAWTVGAEAVHAEEAGARFAMRFHARDVNLVMSPVDDTAVPFRVLLDGEPVGPAAGTDVATDGHGVADRPGTYQLVRQPGPIRDRVVEVEFLAPGAAAMCVTFG